MIRTVLGNMQGASAEVFQFEVPSEGFDLMGAVHGAALEYLTTDASKKAFSGSRGLDLAAFMEKVPDFFCLKHGFSKAGSFSCSVREGADAVLGEEELSEAVNVRTGESCSGWTGIDVAVQFGRIWGIMETLGGLPRNFSFEAGRGRVSIWAQEFLGSGEEDPYAFFQEKLAELE